MKKELISSKFCFRQTGISVICDVVYFRLQYQCYCGQTKCTSVLMLTTKSALFNNQFVFIAAAAIFLVQF